MRNINSLRAMQGARAQKGFTIIELVVVILLLGILTATALPRFMDVTDDARDAVRDATAGGLRTGIALLRAQAIAENLASGDTPTSGDYALEVDGSGYPNLSNGCLGIYQGLLQTGYTTATGTASGATDCVFTLTEVSRQILMTPGAGTVVTL